MAIKSGIKVGILVAFLAVVLIVLFFGWNFFDDYVAPLLFDARIERIHENGLPSIGLEPGGIIYCRMKADDFRFPLPPKSHVLSKTLTMGGYDTVHGKVVVEYDEKPGMRSDAYSSWVQPQVQIGGYLTATDLPGGLAIEFNYFGDR